MKSRIASFLCLVASSLPCAFVQDDAPSRAKYELAQGVAAYKSANYEDAIARFRSAVGLDPDLANARLYLATAYAALYVPGVDEPGNVKMATDAIEQYAEILKRQPDIVASVKGIAYLFLNMKRFEDARQYYQRALAIDANDPETYYSVAVTDWMIVYGALAEERIKLKLKSSQTLIFRAGCRDLRAKNLPIAEEGTTMLTKAISLRPDYDDAMVYMSLLYRSRGDLQCSDPKSQKADERQADEWSDRAMAARKKKAESAQE